MYTMHWHDSLREDPEMWQSFLSFPYISKTFSARALNACQLTHLGPSYKQIIASFADTKSWAQFLDGVIRDNPQVPEASTLIGQNQRLQQILADPLQETFNIVDLPSWGNKLLKSNPYDMADDLPSPNLFLCGNMIIGLAPPAARIGDTIAQFWNTKTSAVVRIQPDGFPRIVGRAGVIKEGSALEWDTPLNYSLFNEDSDYVIHLPMGVAMLTHLSLDDLRLPGG